MPLAYMYFVKLAWPIVVAMIPKAISASVRLVKFHKKDDGLKIPT